MMWDLPSAPVVRLRLLIPMQGIGVQSLVGELKSHMLCAPKAKA